jgi:hypothetical protein
LASHSGVLKLADSARMGAARRAIGVAALILSSSSRLGQLAVSQPRLPRTVLRAVSG